MTEQDQADIVDITARLPREAPNLAADGGPPADRFKELPEGVDAEAAADAIARAFRKHSSKRQARRDRELAAHMAAERSLAIAENRKHALRTIVEDGVKFHFAACACKWHGLRVSDPEVALREYDRHPCTIPLDEIEADHPAFRELRMSDGKLVKRPASILALNQVLPDGTIINSITRPGGVEESAISSGTTAQTEDDFAARVAKLETK